MVQEPGILLVISYYSILKITLYQNLEMFQEPVFVFCNYASNR